MESALRFEPEGRIVTLTIDRPLFGNAVNGQLAQELADAWDRFETNQDLDVAIVTAAGEKDFCLGADMYEMAEHFQARDRGEAVGDQPVVGLAAAGESLRRVTKPLICAVNGRCAGIGLNFVTEADIVVGSDRAAFSDPHVSWGGMSAAALARLLGRLPLDQIMRLALLGKGEWLSAQRALDLGLIGELVSPADLLPRARELARLAAAVNQPAVRAQKVAMRKAIETLHGPAVAAARESSGRFQRATNQREIAAGTSTFVQDRPLTDDQKRQMREPNG